VAHGGVVEQQIGVAGQGVARDLAAVGKAREEDLAGVIAPRDQA
jgi:hypothetical protein